MQGVGLLAALKVMASSSGHLIAPGWAVTTSCRHRELVNQRLCLTHPYIITLHEVFLTPEHLCIAMEYADGGDLTQFVCNYVTHLVRGAATPCPAASTQCLGQAAKADKASPQCGGTLTTVFAVTSPHYAALILAPWLSPDLAQISVANDCGADLKLRSRPSRVASELTFGGCHAAQGSPLPEHIARQLFQQLIIAVDYCHRLGIVNRDIKVSIRCRRRERPSSPRA